MRRAEWVLLLVPLGCGTVHAQEPGTIDSLALARQYTQWLYEGEADSLVAHGSAEARASFLTVEGVVQQSSRVVEMLGFEVDLIEETWKLRSGRCEYWRTASFSNVDEFVLLRWVLNVEGEIDAANIGPASPPPPVDSETCGR